MVSNGKLTSAGASAPVIKSEVAGMTGTASRGVSGANALEGDAVIEKELSENGGWPPYPILRFSIAESDCKHYFLAMFSRFPIDTCVSVDLYKPNKRVVISFFRYRVLSPTCSMWSGPPIISSPQS